MDNSAPNPPSAPTTLEDEVPSSPVPTTITAADLDTRSTTTGSSATTAPSASSTTRSTAISFMPASDCSNPRPRCDFYSVSDNSENLPLPDLRWMLNVNIERTVGQVNRSSGKELLPCCCPRKTTARRTGMRDKSHPRRYCLHGIVLSLQHSVGGSARQGNARRNRRQ